MITQSRSVEHVVSLLGLGSVEGFSFHRDLGGQGRGATCLYQGAQGEKLVVKILLLPKNAYEARAFKSEYEALEILSRSPIKVAPRPRFFKEEDGYLIFGMEYIEGKRLLDLLSLERSPLPWARAIEILHRVASAVAYVSPYYAHRDLHPGNIVFLEGDPCWHPEETDGTTAVNPEVRILDFGSAFLPLSVDFAETAEDAEYINVCSRRVMVGAFASTPPEVYLASDPLRGLFNMVYDTWALGVLLYKLLTGQEPFKTISIGAFLESVKEPVRLPNTLELPTAVLWLLRHALETDVSRRLRPATISQLCWDFRFNKDVLEYDDETLAEYVFNYGCNWKSKLPAHERLDY